VGGKGKKGKGGEGKGERMWRGPESGLPRGPCWLSAGLAGTTLLCPISYKRCNTEFYYVGKIPHIRIDSPSLQATRAFKMGFIHLELSEHLRRMYMRSTECTSSLYVLFIELP